MDLFEIQALLSLAEKLENRISTESDPSVKLTLQTDLEKVKLAIGKRVLELPLDKKIFDTNYTKSRIKSSIQPSELNQLDTFETSGLSISNIESIPDPDSHPKSKREKENSAVKGNELSEQILAEKFSKFLNQRGKKSKSKAQSSKPKNELFPE